MNFTEVLNSDLPGVNIPGAGRGFVEVLNIDVTYSTFIAVVFFVSVALVLNEKFGLGDRLNKLFKLPEGYITTSFIRKMFMIALLYASTLYFYNQFFAVAT